MFQFLKISIRNNYRNLNPPNSGNDIIDTNSKPFNIPSIVSRYPRTSLLIFLLFLHVLLLSFYVDFPSFSSQRLQNPNPNPNPISSPNPIYTNIKPNSNQIPNPNPIYTNIKSNSNPIPSPNPIYTNIKPNSNPSNSNPCRFGKFYVYDLPSELNTELINHCYNIGPFGQSECDHVSNNGLGREATGIDHVIPAKLTNAWYLTDQFTLEIIMHNRLLHHECRTTEPESAVAFYIPLYVGLAARRSLKGDHNYEERDYHCIKMLDWIQTQKPYFNRSNGQDHFITFGRITFEFRRDDKTTDYGSSCILQPPMKKITKLIIEREKSDLFEFGVPYPTGFHPETDNDVLAWQHFVTSRERHALFSYIGAPRYPNDFRTMLVNQCRDAGESCRTVDCSGSKCIDRGLKILETFLDSDFCLQPMGDSYTRRSVFDCMVAGSIPVLFWNETVYIQYPWFLTSEPESYSVFIHHDEVSYKGVSIKSVLEKYSKDEVKTMREKIVEFIPKIIYAKPNKGLEKTKDAVDVVVDQVLKRMRSMNIHGSEPPKLQV